MNWQIFFMLVQHHLAISKNALNKFGFPDLFSFRKVALTIIVFALQVLAIRVYLQHQLVSNLQKLLSHIPFLFL